MSVPYIEKNFGCLYVRLVPVCSVDISDHYPPGTLCDKDGAPLITADGYYLVVDNQ